MGLAVLLDQENCLNFQGLRCDVCYRECPKIDEAITLELDRNMRTGKHARFLPTVHSDACTGCGKCEKVCVLEQPAIKVLPLSLAKGELGHHYRFGWLEGKMANRKRDAGREARAKKAGGVATAGWCYAVSASLWCWGCFSAARGWAFGFCMATTAVVCCSIPSR